MRYPPQILEEIRARLPVSAVVGKRVRLKKAGREWKGLSPFNAEKTPSFYVNDQKQFYHCFSSGKHGDQFSFVMETEGVGFPEAVEREGVGQIAPEHPSHTCLEPVADRRLGLRLARARPWRQGRGPMVLRQRLRLVCLNSLRSTQPVSRSTMRSNTSSGSNRERSASPAISSSPKQLARSMS